MNLAKLWKIAKKVVKIGKVVVPVVEDAVKATKKK